MIYGVVHYRKRIRSKIRKCCCQKSKDEDVEKDEMKIENANGEFAQAHEMQYKSESPRKISTSSGNSHLYISSPAGNDPESQLPDDFKWEFPRHQLKIVEKIGEGCFGQVWKYEAENIGDIEGKSAAKLLRDFTKFCSI